MPAEALSVIFFKNTPFLKIFRRQKFFMELKQSWHNLTQDEALKALESGVAGLSAEEARARSAKYGPNVLKAKKKPPIILSFLRQFLSPLVYVLLFAALIKF